MPLPQAVSDAFWDLADPWLFMYEAAKFIPSTVTGLVREQGVSALFSLRTVRDRWFGNFWGWAAPNIRENGEKRVLPLLAGRVSGGQVLDTKPIKGGIQGLGGVCMEIGAGSGFWVDIFTDSKAGSKVTHVYGIEPNRDQHPALLSRVKAAGLQGVYEIVAAGAEDLDNPQKWGGKIEKESVDCIVSILCLCSIPDPEFNIQELYGYLKKGGRWFVYEHVRCECSPGMRLYQAFVNLFWPHFLGGCQLDRPTEKYLRQAGSWDKIDIGQPSDEQWHHAVPHILGVLTK